jgi:hypothetical protein
MLGFFLFLGVLDQVDDFSAMVEQEAARKLHHWLHVVDDLVFRAFPGPVAGLVNRVALLCNDGVTICTDIAPLASASRAYPVCSEPIASF